MLISAVHLLALFALLLTGWQLRGQPNSSIVWLAILFAIFLLGWSWWRNLKPRSPLIVALAPVFARRWAVRVKGVVQLLDIDVVGWSRVGPLLGLDITCADPNIGKSRVMLLSDQCSPEQWRQLLACLNWMGPEKHR